MEQQPVIQKDVQQKQGNRLVVKLKARRLNKAGNSYHIVVPSAYVDGADLLEAGKQYDVVFHECDECDNDLQSTDFRESESRAFV